MNGKDYFSTNTLVIRKKYEALKSFYKDGLSAKTVAEEFGYTLSAFYSLSRDFQTHLRDAPDTDYFFKDTSLRTKRVKDATEVDAIIIALRKKSFSLSEIKSILLGDVKREMNLEAAKEYLQLRYVPGHETLFKGINKLLPGHTLMYQDINNNNNNNNNEETNVPSDLDYNIQQNNFLTL